MAATFTRRLATVSPVQQAVRSHKIVVIGGGSAGIAASHQLLRKGNFKQDDIAVIDPAQWHHYQPGWTLVGGGLKNKEDLKKNLPSLMSPKFKHYTKPVTTISPEQNEVTLASGEKVSYEQLIVAPGVVVDVNTVKGLQEALDHPDSMVSTIYKYDYCDKAFRTVQNMKSGKAIFTQPAGVVKCAGAPQKIMWLAEDYWRHAGLYTPNDGSKIQMTFATGLPTMFGVPKYSAVLEKLRQEKGIEGLFQHDLVEINGNTAVFQTMGEEKEQVKRQFDFLHVSPKNRPHDFVKNSAVANEAGYVDVNDQTLRHKRFANVWSLGDASSLPTSKTVAAITSQAPILTSNILQAMEGKEPQREYDGYTSCPLLVGDKKVLLAEFKYGGVPKETFNSMFGVDQGVPRRAFYQLKKDFFPWVYGNFHVNGKWGGPQIFAK